MKGFLQNFWLITAVWAGLGNAPFFRVRLRRPIRDGKISKEEADGFVLQLGLWIGGPCLAFGIVQTFFARESLPSFTGWQEPYRQVAVAICLFVWLIGFLWIWFMGGDRKLARIYDLARDQTYICKHPVAFRIAILLMVLAGALALWQTDPAVIQPK